MAEPIMAPDTATRATVTQAMVPQDTQAAPTAIRMDETDMEIMDMDTILAAMAPTTERIMANMVNLLRPDYCNNAMSKISNEVYN